MAGEMTALLQNRLSPPGCWQSEPHSSIIHILLNLHTDRRKLCLCFQLQGISSLPKEGHIPVEQPRMPIMEEIISLGDDLMLGLPSPIIPPEIASHVLEGSHGTSIRRLEALNRGIAKTKPGNIQGEAKGDAVRKKWIFW
ncbi:hypothetical protein MUK42_32585 [Musa troglodytarum]|uniref:DUF7803 domain-containing protein n=1 Tax=Musa troglodytarum TaxID=320322 RepID=A0A9E7L7U2_9LILI|nr:hypothetical protein MUK42_32585 [Musa troglodytarum]